MVAPAGTRVVQDAGLDQNLIRPDGGTEKTKGVETPRVEIDPTAEAKPTAGVDLSATTVARAQPQTEVRAEIGSGDSKEAYAAKARPFRGIGADSARPTTAGTETGNPVVAREVAREVATNTSRETANATRDPAAAVTGLTIGANRDPGPSLLPKAGTGRMS